jgi:uncharacterized membrane protein HdeD (DUF308 family)
MSTPMAPGFARPFAGVFAAGLHELRRNWGWFLLLGIALIILGLVALSATFIATIATVLVLGWILVIDGVFQAAMAFWSRQWSGFFLHVLAGVLALIVGFLMLSKPVAAGLTLTLLLAVFFFVSGFFRILASLIMQFPSWPWVLLSGVINVVLGALIWSEWPESGLWVIGLFVGIDMIFCGWSYVIFALTVRRLPSAAV